MYLVGLHMKHFWISLLCTLSVAGCIVMPMHAGAMPVQIYSDFPHLVNSTLDNGFFDDDGLEHQPPSHEIHQMMTGMKLFKERERHEDDE